MGRGRSKAGGGGGAKTSGGGASKEQLLKESADRVAQILQERAELMNDRTIDYVNDTVTLANGQTMSVDEYSDKVNDLQRRYQKEVDAQKEILGREGYAEATTGVKTSDGGSSTESSSRSSTTLSGLMKKAQDETNPRRVLNNLDDSKFGSTFNSLASDYKMAIKGYLALRKSDVMHLSDRKSKTSQDQSFRLGGKKYTVKIEVDDASDKIVYSLKQGSKNIVKRGTPYNVGNQIAKLLR